jgi:hypothetical protein
MRTTEGVMYGFYFSFDGATWSWEWYRSLAEAWAAVDEVVQEGAKVELGGMMADETGSVVGWQ